jgi:uncharacterized protein YjiS (DUF1127 family)
MSSIKTSATLSLTQRPRGTAGFLATLRQDLVRAFDTLLLWQERDFERHSLAQQDARMLADMGISRAEAREEAAKPFWRA